MKRYIVAENPQHKGARRLPKFRPIIAPNVRGRRNPHIVTRPGTLKIDASFRGRPAQSFRAATAYASRHGGDVWFSPRKTIQKKGENLRPGRYGMWRTPPLKDSRKKAKKHTKSKPRAARSESRALVAIKHELAAVRRQLAKPARVAPATRSPRGKTAKGKGGRSMASQAQKSYRAFFKARRKAGMTAKAIGAEWRRSHGHHNPRGVPLSGEHGFRPSLPKGPARAVVASAKKKWEAALKRAASHGRKVAGKKKSSKKGVKAHGNPFYTVFNRPKHKKSKSRGISAHRARSMAMKRWYGHSSRGHCNPFSVSGVIDNAKKAVSKDTLVVGLATLVGAVAATGGPTFIPSWNVGWYGVGLSIAAAALAGVGAAMIAPKYLTPVAAGGVVVVGLRLVGQFMPRALGLPAPVPAVSPAGVSGFMLNNAASRGRTGVGGYLTPPPGAVSMRKLGGLGASGSARAMVRAGNEGFKSPKI